MKVKIIQGHVLEALKQIPDNSIDCIITSPPYWGLRKYPDSADVIWDGDPNCEHEWETYIRKGQGGGTKSEKVRIKGVECFQAFPPSQQAFCKKCGAWYGQLGLEPTLEMYIEHLLQITKELKRVLKPTGIMFWNHGSSYAGPMGKHKGWSYVSNLGSKKDGTAINFEGKTNLPAKCETLQNFRLALRMIDEQGWILRNVIIWYKPNHLPESVKDRFTKSYEPVFMFVKSKKYFFNLDAVREPAKTLEKYSFNIRVGEAKKGYFEKFGVRDSEEEIEKYDNQGRLIEKYDESWIAILGKNPGDVWVINTEPFPEPHFATFPTALVKRCIKAGCPEGGVVLDPFVGSGTTIKVAIEERRNVIGIEIVPEYVKMAERRCNLVGNPFIEYEKIGD
jgi:site-specific DNA-methyltransferase (cytosine-N4-specific)